ncbi:MAG: 50S ribosomal protein L9 [Proteobacteria bacterium]|nr:50S ribosomal protein L9 [Pseudomonadota bacterium]
MKSVEILLREPVKDLGAPGDVVKVAAGYARNYLLPRHLGVAATDENKRIVVKRRAAYDKELVVQAAALDALVGALEGVKIEAVEKADTHGHLYGSVNAARIAELLVAAGHGVTEKQVRLEAPVRKVGESEVVIHLQESTDVTITLLVSPEGAAS